MYGYPMLTSLKGWSCFPFHLAPYCNSHGYFAVWHPELSERRSNSVCSCLNHSDSTKHHFANDDICSLQDSILQAPALFDCCSSLGRGTIWQVDIAFAQIGVLNFLGTYHCQCHDSQLNRGGQSVKKSGILGEQCWAQGKSRKYRMAFKVYEGSLTLVWWL